jgi:hypothetical protein
MDEARPVELAINVDRSAAARMIIGLGCGHSAATDQRGIERLPAMVCVERRSVV